MFKGQFKAYFKLSRGGKSPKRVEGGISIPIILFLALAGVKFEWIREFLNQLSF